MPLYFWTFFNDHNLIIQDQLSLVSDLYLFIADQYIYI